LASVPPSSEGETGATAPDGEIGATAPDGETGATAPDGECSDVAAPSAELTRRQLEARLSTELGRPVALTLTENRRTMLSTRRRGHVLCVRLHSLFGEAGQGVVHDLVRYLRDRDRHASARLNEYIEQRRDRIRARSQRTVTTRTVGEYHDLGAIFEELNQRWFDGRVDARITWSRRSSTRRRRRRSIRLGAYQARDQLIRVHPVLDQAWVPRFFVAYIVFHEMLHHVLPEEKTGGRRRMHTAEFRARERAYPDYERALEWEKRHLEHLLRG
jgi:hypothetical protein